MGGNLSSRRMMLFRQGQQHMQVSFSAELSRAAPHPGSQQAHYTNGPTHSCRP